MHRVGLWAQSGMPVQRHTFTKLHSLVLAMEWPCSGTGWCVGPHLDCGAPPGSRNLAAGKQCRCLIPAALGKISTATAPLLPNFQTGGKLPGPNDAGHGMGVEHHWANSPVTLGWGFFPLNSCVFFLAKVKLLFVLTMPGLFLNRTIVSL